MKNNVVAVVVTYNRKELLVECLNAILSQTYSVSKIVLIDNASTDGTTEYLKDNHLLDNECIEYIRMDENLGGSGGFYEGIKHINNMNSEIDWVWVMDDDTIPTETCLEKLLDANNKIMSSPKVSGMESVHNPSFYASAIYGPENEFMNLPNISTKPSPNGYSYWYKYLTEGMVSISDATFVSILINKKAIDKCGLPCKDYFIWGDDTEYTTRLTTYFGDAYFVGESIAIHKRFGAKVLRIDNESDPKRRKMFHYLYRNNAINDKFYHNKSIYLKLIKQFIKFILYIFNSDKRSKQSIMLKGLWEATTQYNKFKNYIVSQLNQ